ncbi:hypothetical protein VXN63_02245 [Marinilactibacillus sp. XAAS-LB27]|uniref:hypothetical protein n=1 Tax=Marinilactibacillus sp. XAAS-LB27 TaxID=3114538 RepID=UPI002E184094|nr:hypothetical protein [Marinilactibacillus sp. XAAS-LB27]
MLKRKKEWIIATTIFGILFIFGEEIYNFFSDLSVLQNIGLHGLFLLGAFYTLSLFPKIIKSYVNEERSGFIDVFNKVIQIIGCLIVVLYLATSILVSFSAILYFIVLFFDIEHLISIQEPKIHYTYIMVLNIWIPITLTIVIKKFSEFMSDFKSIKSSESKVSIVIAVIALLISLLRN